MFNFDKVDLEPAMCVHCHELVEVNCLSKRSRCPMCKSKIIFYDPSMHSKDEDDLAVKWKKAFLSTRENLCPKCGMITLGFIEEGCFD